MTKRNLSRIKREAAVLYAVAHPEVRLADIGLAVGYPLATAKSTVSGELRRRGFSRPHGKASPAFPLDTFKATRKYDYDAVARFVRAHPTWTYAEVGEHVGVNQYSISTIMRASGYRRGYQDRPTCRNTDEQILTYLRSLERPKPMTHMLWDLGYKERSAQPSYRIQRLMKIVNRERRKA